MPRKEVVIGVAAQDVQIISSMTGGHVGATPSSLLTDEGIPRFLFGDMISGATLMCRMHEYRGCMDNGMNPLHFLIGLTMGQNGNS